MFTPWRVAWSLFPRMSQNLFGPEKLFYICCVCIQDHSFNNFENTMKLSVNEAKLTGL